uniref:Uncharacterized protein n=1 Tax=Rhizophora mucronata TaxID=61149 RepID=A0A2P2IX41_RHIMU
MPFFFFFVWIAFLSFEK